MVSSEADDDQKASCDPRIKLKMQGTLGGFEHAAQNMASQLSEKTLSDDPEKLAEYKRRISTLTEKMKDDTVKRLDSLQFELMDKVKDMTPSQAEQTVSVVEEFSRSLSKIMNTFVAVISSCIEKIKELFRNIKEAILNLMDGIRNLKESFFPPE